MDSLTLVLNAPPAVRRLAAAALTLAAALAIGGGLYVAASSVASKVQEVADKRAQLGRLNAVLALRPAIEASLPSDNAGESQPEFLHGESEAVIRAGLQTRLAKIASDHRVAILSVGNTPILQQGQNRYAGLRANIAGTNEGIVGAIAAIDTASPYLTIREARLQSTLESQVVGAKGPTQLVMQIQFYGALPPEAEAGGKDGAAR